MGNLLASVYDGDDAPLRALVSDREVYKYVRAAAVPKAYQCLVLAGKICREDVETYAAELLTEGLEREPGFIWDGWTSFCADFGLSRLVPLLQRAIDEDLCDPL